MNGCFVAKTFINLEFHIVCGGTDLSPYIIQFPAIPSDSKAALLRNQLPDRRTGQLAFRRAYCPQERAETRMWARRIDLNISENLGCGFRYAEGLPLFKNRMHCIPQAADDFKEIAQEKLAWLDGLMEGKEFNGGDRFTLADLLLFAVL